MTFQLMRVHNIFSSVWVAEWLSFGKELLIRLTIGFFVFLVISRFGLRQDLGSD